MSLYCTVVRWSFRALAACLAFVAQAQTTAPPAFGSAATQLAPVIVQGRDTDLLGVAASASQGIVGATDLDARPFLRRGELLEVIPGVIVTQHSGNGKANQYFLRGFNLDHGTDFSLSVDGMPVNLRSHAHGQGYADLNFLIPELIRHIDYNKGPFYAEVGDFSAAGAARFRQLDAIARPFVTVAAGENHFARFVAGGTLLENRAALTGVVEISRDDGPWQLRENASRVNAFVRRHWTRDAAEFRLTAMAYRGRWRSSDQIPFRAVAAGRLDRFGHLDPTGGGESERASVSFDASLNGAAGTTRLNAYAISYRLNLFSNFTYFLDDPVNGDQFNQRDRRWLLGGGVQQTRSHGAGSVQSETTLGAQAQMDFIGELGLHRTLRRARLATVRDDEVTEASLAFFAQNETRWTEWLRSAAGVRADGYRFRVASNDTHNSGARLADIFSPKLSVALGPWQKTEIYANAGFGFHSNDARGVTLRVDPADGTAADPVTPLARARGAELGLRTTALRGVVMTISWWALDLDSELVFAGDAGSTEPAGRTRRHGVELANFCRLSPWCAVDADVAFTHARYRGDVGVGTRIANSISSVVTAGVVLGKGYGWFGSARVRYYGSQPLVEDNSVRAPSSLTFNARIGWRRPEWECALEILNLAGRKNYDIAYHYASRLRGEAVAGVNDVHFHPAEPWTARVGVTRRF